MTAGGSRPSSHFHCRQIIFLSITAHIHYVRSGRFRHVLAAAAWLAVGVFFFEKAAVIPLLLFGITAAFLVEGGLAASARQSLVRYWRAWVVYAGLVAAYGALLLEVLRSSTSSSRARHR